MSLAVLLAASAGACVAAGAVDLFGSSGRRAGVPGRPTARRPGPLRRVLIVIGRRIGVAAPADLPARMEAAGLDGGRAGEVASAKSGAALLATLMALLLGGALPGRLGLLAVIAMPAAAFLAPDLVLRRRTRARAITVARELPDVLDLLRVAVQSGLGPPRAMTEVGARAAGLLAVELRDAARRLTLGEPADVVLTRFALRCPGEGSAAFVAAVRRAERHGAPLAPSLAALATDARAERARALRDQAARAAPKIQLVVALGLVPGVLLLVAAMLVPRVL